MPIGRAHPRRDVGLHVGAPVGVVAGVVASEVIGMISEFSQ